MSEYNEGTQKQLKKITDNILRLSKTKKGKKWLNENKKLMKIDYEKRRKLFSKGDKDAWSYFQVETL